MYYYVSKYNLCNKYRCITILVYTIYTIIMDVLLCKYIQSTIIMDVLLCKFSSNNSVFPFF